MTYPQRRINPVKTISPMNKIFLVFSMAMCVSCMCQQNNTQTEIPQEPVTLPIGKSPIEIKMEEIGLVDIETLTDDIPVSLMYARDDNFTGRILYEDLNRAYLHPDAAKALLKAQAELKKIRPDLSLKVYDAARPMSVQQAMFDVVKGTDQQIYVSNPAKGGGLHNYGLAVDVSLCDVATGDTLTMGTHIDYFGLRAQVRHEEQFLADSTLSREAYENRLLLRKVMTAAGYKVLSTEWWHFNFKTRAEARENYTVIP